MGLSRDGRRDPRGDRARADRPLRRQARGSAGRAVPPGGLDVPAGVGGGATDGAVRDPRGRRLLGGPRVRAQVGARELRVPARVLPRRLGRGAEPARKPAAGRAARRDPPRRHDAHEPERRRADPGDRLVGRARGQRDRPADRRRRARRAVGRRLRGLRGLSHSRGRHGRHRRAGQIELDDPQLPRVPAGHQRRAPCPARVRAGLDPRRPLRVHADRDRSLGGRRSTRGQPLGVRRDPGTRGRPRHRRGLPPARRPGTRGAQRRRGLLRRRRLRREPRGRPGRLRARRRELRGTGRLAPRSVRTPCDAGRARLVARGRHVAVRRSAAWRDAERRRQARRPRSSAAVATAG